MIFVLEMLQMHSPKQNSKNNERSLIMLEMKYYQGYIQLLHVGIHEIESMGRQYGSVSSKSFSSRMGEREIKRDKTFQK